MSSLLQYVVCGASGGALSQLFDYAIAKRMHRRSSVVRSLLITALAAILCGAWFTLVDRTGVRFYTAIQYGLFLGLLFDEIRLQSYRRRYGPPKTGPTSWRKRQSEGAPPPQTGAGQSQYMLAATAAKPVAGMILMGFWPVFGVGLVGGVITAAAVIKGGRKTVYALSLKDWVYWAFVVVLGAIVAVLHGIDGVNALTVLQLGSTFPLLKRAL